MCRCLPASGHSDQFMFLITDPFVILNPNMAWGFLFLCYATWHFWLAACRWDLVVSSGYFRVPIWFDNNYNVRLQESHNMNLELPYEKVRHHLLDGEIGHRPRQASTIFSLSCNCLQHWSLRTRDRWWQSFAILLSLEFVGSAVATGNPLGSILFFRIDHTFTSAR